MRVNPNELSEMHPHTEKIRNICILAHVDHGKTTLSDSLVCSNGVISSKLAGKLRYLDSTEEEQRRGITMHSSAISLIFDLEKQTNEVVSPTQTSSTTHSSSKDRYLINLVDSPGHLDFSSDVSTATRLCDGALIVVDVLEGICTQTHAVIFKALKERMRPVLILNKIDRLMIDMKLTTVEAFFHLRRLIEKANALAFTLVNSEIRLYEELRVATEQSDLSDIPFLNAEMLLDEWQLTPEKGNVIFASALDCWGFGLGRFANMWAHKLGVNKTLIQKYIFGDYSFNMKDKKIMKYDPQTTDSGVKPMFAEMVLDPIWQLYDSAIINNDPEKAAQMATKLGIELPPREINTRDSRSTLQAIFRRWLSLSDAILRTVVRCMPNPVEAQFNRLYTLLDLTGKFSGKSVEKVINNSLQKDIHQMVNRMKSIRANITRCDSSTESDVVVFVSKMVPVKSTELAPADLAMMKARASSEISIKDSEGNTTLQKINGNNVLSEDGEVFVAMGRVYSGVLTRNSNLYVLSSRHNPLDISTQFSTCDLDSELSYNLDGSVPSLLKATATRVPVGTIGLYLCLGPSVTPVDKVSAGNIVAIVGLDQIVLKTATISTSWACQPLKAMTFQAQPMVRVAVEPKSHVDLPRLENGLASLYQYDPAVEIGVDEVGQHTLSCLGELHLELCIKSLTDRFAKCEVVVSEPLVPYRETVLPCDNSFKLTLPPPWCDIPGLSDSNSGQSKLVLASGNIILHFSCFALPPSIVKLLDQNAESATLLSELLSKQGWTTTHLNDSTKSASSNSLSQFLVKYSQTVISKSIDSDTECGSGNSHYEQSYNRLGSTLHSAQDVQNVIVSIGSKSVTSNLLVVNPSMTFELRRSRSNDVDSTAASTTLLGSFSVFNSSQTQSETFKIIWNRIQNAVTTGFQETCSSGPLMNEPIYGVGFSIDRIEVSLSTCVSCCMSVLPNLDHLKTAFSSIDSSIIDAAMNDESSQSSNNTAMILSSGHMISEVKSALRLCMLSCPLRLVEPIYACDLQCDQSQLGNLYAVLSKRRGEVTKEDIIDGTSLFILSATLPISESFGFAQELLRKTSGNATAPQLVFSHWNIIQEDPFWRPQTDDEVEQYGDNYIGEHNIFRVRIDKVRKRKGLQVEEKVVVSAEKQRNMNKKK